MNHTMRRFRLLLTASAIGLGLASAAWAQSTRPAGRAGRGAEPPIVQRLRERADQLNLTDDQKVQVQALKDEIAETVRGLGPGVADLPPAERREKLRMALGGVREKLMAILTPEQKRRLREDGPAHRPPATPVPTTAPASTAPSPAPSTAPSPASASPASARPAVGSPAPAFTAARLSGSDATNKSYAGKPLVLAFGSLTSPGFRDRLPKLDQLRNKYRGRANVVVVYTKEAHPADGWQVARNRDDKVELNAPTTMKERQALATKLKDLSRASIEIVVDDMDDTTLHAFGDTPEGAIVISPAGTVVGSQTFCDPSGLPRMIDEAMKAKD